MFRMTSAPGFAAVFGTVADMPSLLHTAHFPEINQTFQRERMEEIDGSSTFGGIGSAASAADMLMRTGWDAGLARARAQVPNVTRGLEIPEAQTRKRKRVIGPEGDTIRLDAVMAGNWDRAYESRRKRFASGPAVLSVACGFGGNIFISHEEMFYTGLQMLAVAELLESAGWQTEIRAVKLNEYKGTGHIHVQDWTCKEAGQPLRAENVISLFGHAGVYRTFGWLGNAATHKRVPFGGGSVLEGAKFDKAFRAAAQAGVIASADLMVPPAYDIDTARRNVRAAIEQATARIAHAA